MPPSATAVGPEADARSGQTWGDWTVKHVGFAVHRLLSGPGPDVVLHFANAIGKIGAAALEKLDHQFDSLEDILAAMERGEGLED